MLSPASRSLFVGAGLMLAAQFVSASVMTAVKLVSNDIPTLDIIFIGYSISLVLMIALLWCKRDINIKTSHLPLQLLRSGFGAMYFGGLFWAVSYIPVVDTILLRSTAPIWAPFIAYFFLKQPFIRGMWSRILLAFVGVLLILHPTLVAINPGYLIGLGAAICYAISGLLIKKLHAAGEPVFRTLFYAFLIPAVVLLPYMLMHIPNALTLNTCLLLLVVGIGTMTLLLLYVSSLRYISIQIALPLTYFGVVFAAFYDWALWGQAPHLLTLLGMVCVFAGCYSLILLESRS